MITFLSHSPQALAAIAAASPQFLATLVSAIALVGVFLALMSSAEPEDPTDF